MTLRRTVLVTGGSGFIGSHTCVALIESGHEVIVIDDFSNSSPEALVRVETLTGTTPTFYELDLRDRPGLSDVFARHDIDVVIHFAAKKAVGESTQIPLDYFDVNIGCTTSLLRVMHEYGVHRLVFSSSCSIYGDALPKPLTESDVAGPTNPYAWSKWTCEQLIEQATRYHPEMRATALRYFNPIGAHGSGVLGEAPKGPLHNVMPYLMQVAAGRLPALNVFGDDYPTPDGTAVRDYIHVVDVADGHVAAVEHVDDAPGMQVFNLGTGVGTSVLQLCDAFAQASGREIASVICERRMGDVATLVGDPRKVEVAWGWRTRFDLDAMCRDAWNFQILNPNGYAAGVSPDVVAAEGRRAVGTDTVEA